MEFPSHQKYLFYYRDFEADIRIYNIAFAYHEEQNNIVASQHGAYPDFLERVAKYDRTKQFILEKNNDAIDYIIEQNETFSRNTYMKNFFRIRDKAN